MRELPYRFSMSQIIELEHLAARRFPEGCVVTSGNFDGVHRGHRALLDAASLRARSLGLPLVALTFDPHTRQFLDPAGGPQLLTTWMEREVLLREAGAVPVTLRFDDQVRRLSAQEFVGHLVDDLGARELVLGFDNRFGRGASGSAEGITPYCQERGVPLSVVGPLRDGSEAISSTRIRAALGEWGRYHEAMNWLGRPWFLMGEVVHGDGRGRTLGFPTANLEPVSPRKCLPASGVYAARLTWEGVEPQPAVVNIGSAPTFSRGIRVVEVHVPAENGPGPGPGYGQICRLDLYFALRQECRFESLDALRAQIGHDAETARKMVSGLP
ncbi:MAG: riboflavin biosynthesis protein RibF [Fibrobacteria bacterium]|nr:riboflavin biosynthesis protein RibF [Fibrobacteria bacterium]